MEPRTDQEVIDQTNELARALYKIRGYELPHGYKFHEASHPQEREAWLAACTAQILLTDTDPDDALAAVEE